MARKNNEEKQLEIVNKASKKAHIWWFVINFLWWASDIIFGYLLGVDLVPGVTDAGEVIFSVIIWGLGHIIIAAYFSSERKKARGDEDGL